MTENATRSRGEGLDEVDVLVVGYGAAGAAAALAAHDAGARVLVVEKCAQPGGNSLVSSANTVYPERSEDVDRFRQYLTEVCDGTTPAGESKFSWEFTMLHAELHRQGVPAVICSIDDLRYDSTHRRLYTHDADGHRHPITVVYRRALLNDLLSRYGPAFIDHPLPRAWSTGACVMVNSFTSQLATKKSALTLFADPRTSVMLSPQEAARRPATSTVDAAGAPRIHHLPRGRD